jgi:hypothetical protein
MVVRIQTISPSNVVNFHVPITRERHDILEKRLVGETMYFFCHQYVDAVIFRGINVNVHQYDVEVVGRFPQLACASYPTFLKEHLIEIRLCPTQSSFRVASQYPV